MTVLRLRIVGHSLPGLQWCDQAPVYVGVQRGSVVVDLVPGDAGEAVFDLSVDVVARDDGERDFRGPYAQGKRGDRFLYLSWGTLGADGRFVMFRRAKIRFAEIPTAEVEHALATGETLVGTLSLTGERGGPVCAAVRPPRIRWQSAAPVSA
ncbi:MAG TPA: DUF5990 family protein [Dehalococcoidia bacterium]|nr:DUF5990 family protein [Dehalococcoidia bacterium]